MKKTTSIELSVNKNFSMKVINNAFGDHVKIVISYDVIDFATDSLDEQILTLLSNNNGVQTKYIAERVEITRRQLLHRISVLRQKGLISTVGGSKNDPTTKHYICDNWENKV